MKLSQLPKLKAKTGETYYLIELDDCDLHLFEGGKGYVWGGEYDGLDFTWRNLGDDVDIDMLGVDYLDEEINQKLGEVK